MSQKKEREQQSDKWRELAEEELKTDAESAPENDIMDGEDRNPELAQLKDQLVRARAEVENMHRRMEQEVKKVRQFGIERLVSELIPVVDSLVRGMEGAASDDPQVQQMRKGMELTLGILDKVLEKNGITSISPNPGDPFDPALHEAMSMRPEPSAKPNTILQVLQKGYALNGRVIRAAMVIVSA